MPFLSQLLSAQVAEVRLVETEHRRTGQEVAALLQLADAITLRTDDQVLRLANRVVIGTLLLQVDCKLLTSHAGVSGPVTLRAVVLIASQAKEVGRINA